MIPNGVTVAMYGNKKVQNGLSISWATQVEKEHVILSLPSSSQKTKELLKEDLFTLNVLNVNQTEVAKYYGGKEVKDRETSKPIIHFLESGLPVVNNCCYSIVCRVIANSVLNKQLLVTCKIEEIARQSNKKPLIYDKSQFFEN